MQHTPSSRRRSRFPLVFEFLIWSLYVGCYKYAQYLGEAVPLSLTTKENFPYPQLILFALVATLYIVPYYRWLVPTLLQRRRYVVLTLVSLLYLWWAIKLNAVLATVLFRPVAGTGLLLDFYTSYHHLNLQQLPRLANAQITLLFTDWLAFSCVAFVRLAFQQEARRHQVEKDHLALQLEQLKTQLQPHFLFNTLNSIYGLSLAGSPDTPRFILLLSELMRYVLYDSGRASISLTEEIVFLENYFELEQRKYPGARIRFATLDSTTVPPQVPPLLLLPLVENSFKHGRHHHTEHAGVEATLTTRPGQLCFTIENDMLPEAPRATARRTGGIGLQNIQQRLQLYYPGGYELQLSQPNGRYRAELTITLPQ